MDSNQMSPRGDFSVKRNSDLYSAFVKKGVEESFQFLFQKRPDLLECEISEVGPDFPSFFGLMKMSGDQHEVISIIAFPKETLVGLAKGSFDVGDPVESKYLRECLGELSNIISGAIRGQLLAEGLKIPLCLPETSLGQQCLLDSTDLFLKLKFNLGTEPFHFYLTIRSTPPAIRKIS